MIIKPKPRYEIAQYRTFIRDAAPYVSLIIGRRLSAAEADLLTDEQIHAIALKIDERVKDMKIEDKGES